MNNLQRFFYILMRDHVTPGTVSKIIRDHLVPDDNEKPVFTNPHLSAISRTYINAIFNDGEIDYDI